MGRGVGVGGFFANLPSQIVVYHRVWYTRLFHARDPGSSVSRVVSAVLHYVIPFPLRRFLICASPAGETPVPSVTAIVTHGQDICFCYRVLP